MKFKVQVVTLADDGEESVREVAWVEREDLTPASLGLSVADSKAILQGIQEVVAEWQMHDYLDAQRHCPQCGKPRHSEGFHHTVFRTVFGDLPVESPRFTSCPCQAHATESFSPLAALLPERTTPRVALSGNEMGVLGVIWHECEAVADSHACAQWRLGGRLPKVVSGIPCVHAARVRVSLSDSPIFVPSDSARRRWGACLT
jgi:hypothetical protein